MSYADKISVAMQTASDVHGVYLKPTNGRQKP